MVFCDVELVAGLLLSRRVARAVVGAVGVGVPVGVVVGDVGVSGRRVGGWVRGGVLERGLLEVVGERAVEGVSSDAMWADLLGLDWWELDGVGAGVVGPFAELSRALFLGLLSRVEVEKLLADVSPRRVGVAPRVVPPVLGVGVPDRVRWAGRVLLGVRVQRALLSAVVSGGVGVGRVADVWGVDVSVAQVWVSRVLRRGVERVGLEGEALRVVDGWRLSQGF